MKNKIRGLIIVTGILFLAGSVLAQTITITEPSAGKAWFKKYPHTIKWTIKGLMHGFIKIRLYNKAANVKIKDITNNAGNNGSYEVPANFFNDVPNGEYRIRVKTLVGNIWDDSDVFTLGTFKAKVDLSKLRFKIVGQIFPPDYTPTVGLNISIAPPENWKYPSYFNVMIKNIGKGRTNKSTNDRILLYYLGRDGQLKLRPQVFNEYWHKTINPIEPGKFTLHIIKYFFKYPGKYVLKVWVDDPNYVKESNEINNSIVETFWVKEK